MDGDSGSSTKGFVGYTRLHFISAVQCTDLTEMAFDDGGAPGASVKNMTARSTSLSTTHVN